MKPKRLMFDDWLNKRLKKPSFRRAFKREDVRARLALRIAEVRKAKGISQVELAQRLGTTQQMVSDIETFQQANITLGTLQRIADALQAPLTVRLG